MAKNQNGFKEGMEVWEETLIREAMAIRQMNFLGAGPVKRVNRTGHQSGIANVQKRDRRALYT